MNNFDESGDSSFIMYIEKNNLHEKAMLSKLLLNGLK